MSMGCAVTPWPQPSYLNSLLSSTSKKTKREVISWKLSGKWVTTVRRPGRCYRENFASQSEFWDRQLMLVPGSNLETQTSLAFHPQTPLIQKLPLNKLCRKVCRTERGWHPWKAHPALQRWGPAPRHPECCTVLRINSPCPVWSDDSRAWLTS